MNPIHEHVVKTIAAALGGIVIGWSSSALTMAGRVEALEKSQMRVEQMLTTLLLAQGARVPAPGAAKP